MLPGAFHKSAPPGNHGLNSYTGRAIWTFDLGLSLCSLLYGQTSLGIEGGSGWAKLNMELHGTHEAAMLMNLNRSAPNDLAALFAQSRNCLSRYDFQGAVELLQRAHKLEPANDKILVDLGAACAKAYDFAAAQRWFEEAVRLSPTPVPALNAVGHAWLEVRNFEAAQICFERILQQKQVPLITYVRLSEIYTRLRRLEDAARASELALRCYGPEDSALLARAKVHHQMGQLDWAERLCGLLVGKPDGDPATRAFAWYDLAALHDLKGNYDQAMTALLEAKALMRRGAAAPLK